MSTRAVDPFAIGVEISALAMRLGNLKGQARERGYPLLPDARLVDCDKLVLSVFDKHRELVAQMRSELDAIYSKLRSVSTDLEAIRVPELKEVFEGQLKHLHGERGTLDHSLNVFDSLMSAHVLIEELENSAISVHDQVVSFSDGKMGVEDWESIDSSIEDLLFRLQIVFPDSKKGAEDFCQKHHESKQEILQILRACRFDLNWKKGELLEKSRKECDTTLEILLPALEKLRRGRISDQDIEGIQKLFGVLPLELRMLLFAARSILPDVQFDNTFIFDAPPCRGASPDVWAEVRGLSYYDSERDLNKYQSSVNTLLDKCKEQRKAVVSEREKARQSLDKFVAKLPEDEMRNPQLLLEAFDLLYSKKLCPMSPAMAKILEACMAGEPEKIEVEVSNDVGQALETFETRLQNIPVLGSIKKIKEQVQAYKEAKMYDTSQREQLVRALLDAAENKGGVSLNVDKGVYYWIWYLAHEKDPSAGGDNFGKNHAPKDLDRLIAAIEKAMPVKETTAKVASPPEIKIESVSLPLSPMTLSPKITPRRYSTPNPKSGGVGRPLRPSEVKNGNGKAKVISAPAPVIKTPLPAPVVTEVKVKCKVPEGHFLAIRGEGGDLNWNRGIKLVMLDKETYVHKMEGVAGKVKYKILLDDVQYESGGDHVIEAQKSEQIVPFLAMPKVVAVVNFAPNDNKLFVCGTGPGMSWDHNKKVELKSVGGKFVLESNVEGDFIFKILLSNNQWSKGDNFKAEKGKIPEITPVF